MAPRLPILLLTICPLGACASAAEEQAAALRLALENSRASYGTAAPAAPAVRAPAALPTAPPILAPTSPILAAAAPSPATPSLTTPGPAAADQLLGLGPELLRRWLGEPSLRRVEGGAEVWLYAGAACALDLVLYPQSGRLRVAHASARASGTEPRTEAGCLQELASRANVVRSATDRGGA